MRIEIDVSKTIEENAVSYYEKSKKAKRKIEGLRKAMLDTERKISSLGIKKEISQQPKKSIKREKKWFEKFRWFYTSEGFLCIGGRDATTNDIIIKKYVSDDDLIFHTEAPGSPFFVIKCEGKTPGEKSSEEAAIATASFSKSWSQGFSTAEVYCVNPDQIKKELGLPKGSFMIYGKRKNYNAALKLAVGIYQEMPMCGPVESVNANCEKFVIILQGNDTKSDVANKIRKYLNTDIELNDIISVLPPGTCLMQSAK